LYLSQKFHLFYKIVYGKEHTVWFEGHGVVGSCKGMVVERNSDEISQTGSPELVSLVVKLIVPTELHDHGIFWQRLVTCKDYQGELANCSDALFMQFIYLKHKVECN
jgi:hypothetical protein